MLIAGKHVCIWRMLNVFNAHVFNVNTFQCVQPTNLMLPNPLFCRVSRCFIQSNTWFADPIRSEFFLLHTFHMLYNFESWNLSVYINNWICDFLNFCIIHFLLLFYQSLTHWKRCEWNLKFKPILSLSFEISFANATHTHTQFTDRLWVNLFRCFCCLFLVSIELLFVVVNFLLLIASMPLGIYILFALIWFCVFTLMFDIQRNLHRIVDQ